MSVNLFVLLVYPVQLTACPHTFCSSGRKGVVQENADRVFRTPLLWD